MLMLFYVVGWLKINIELLYMFTTMQVGQVHMDDTMEMFMLLKHLISRIRRFLLRHLIFRIRRFFLSHSIFSSGIFFLSPLIIWN